MNQTQCMAYVHMALNETNIEENEKLSLKRELLKLFEYLSPSEVIELYLREMGIKGF